MGDPRNGHQCYKTINIENKLCFDGKSIGEFYYVFNLSRGETMGISVSKCIDYTLYCI